MESRLIWGLIILVFGVAILFFELIIGIIFSIFGLVILLNKNEDKIEQINSKGGKKR